MSFFQYLQTPKVPPRMSKAKTKKAPKKEKFTIDLSDRLSDVKKGQLELAKIRGYTIREDEEEFIEDPYDLGITMENAHTYFDEQYDDILGAVK